MVELIKVLYVDDDPVNLDVFRLQLRGNYDIYTADSGKEGLDILHNQPNIRVIISDMRMPEMDGLQFVREAKRLMPHISCFILTAFDITEEIQEALDNKTICYCFRKPFSRHEINSILEEVKKGKIC